MTQKFDEQIAAMMEGQTKQVSFRCPMTVLDLLRKCGRLVYGPLPEKGSLTTYALYFICYGLLRFLDDNRKAGQPIIEVEIDNERGRVDVKRGKRGD